MCQTDGGLGGAGDVGANGAFTVAVHCLSVGMLTHAAASTNMPAHATHVWKKAITTHIRQTELQLRAHCSATSLTTVYIHENVISDAFLVSHNSLKRDLTSKHTNFWSQYVQDLNLWISSKGLTHTWMMTSVHAGFRGAAIFR